MLKRQFSLVLIALMLLTMAIPATAQTPTRSPVSSGSLTVAVPATIDGQAVPATFTIKRFVRDGSGVAAEGTLTLQTATGPMVTAATMPVTLPTPTAGPSIQQAVCEILDLTLGPLDLNLAGLMVHLDTVHLLITADPTGGLLGSLLSGLLCGSGGLGGLLGNLSASLQQVVNILNQILAILG